MGWELPQTVIEAIAAEEELTDPGTVRPTFVDDRLPSSTELYSSQLSQQPVSLQPVAQQPSSTVQDPTHTVVSIANLDWRDDVEFLQPPYDMLLVADVVRPHKAAVNQHHTSGTACACCYLVLHDLVQGQEQCTDFIIRTANAR